jgi:hypothetical protein
VYSLSLLMLRFSDTLIDTLRVVFCCFLLNSNGLYCMYLSVKCCLLAGIKG